MNQFIESFFDEDQDKNFKLWNKVKGEE